MRLTSDDSDQRDLGSAWVVLAQSEARHLYESLKFCFQEADSGHPDPGWHCHVGDGDRPELTVAVDSGSASREGTQSG